MDSRQHKTLYSGAGKFDLSNISAVHAACIRVEGFLFYIRWQQDVRCIRSTEKEIAFEPPFLFIHGEGSRAVEYGAGRKCNHVLIYTMLLCKEYRVGVSSITSVSNGDSVHKTICRDLSLFSADYRFIHRTITQKNPKVVCAILVEGACSKAGESVSKTDWEGSIPSVFALISYNGMVTSPDCKLGPRKQIGVMDFGVSRFESYLCHILFSAIFYKMYSGTVINESPVGLMDRRKPSKSVILGIRMHLPLQEKSELTALTKVSPLEYCAILFIE